MNDRVRELMWSFLMEHRASCDLPKKKIACPTEGWYTEAVGLLDAKDARIKELEDEALGWEASFDAEHLGRITSEARVKQLEDALRVAVSWWEAKQIISSERPTDREVAALDDARELIDLPRLRTQNTANSENPS